MNKNQTSNSMASLAGKVLHDPNASDIQKTLAGSVLSQANPNNQTGAKLEDIAANALSSSKYNETTKSLAGSVLSQSEKNR